MKRSIIFILALLFLVSADTAIPRVLIIGDSISLGYTPYVQEMLEGEAVVLHNHRNAQYTGTGLLKIDEWLGEERWDVIHFNWGLWDLYGWRYQDTLRTPETYARNLEILVQRLEKSGARLIWATTTPVCPGPEKKCLKIINPETEKAFREAALKVMKKHKIRVNDLHTLMLPHLEQYSLGTNDVHFTPEGYEFLAEKVAEEIRKQL